eukprot:c1780_g1_i1.p1 GENE.c1780_g1_i1~~c1780_g1_i1.p1  ORF type:complete len:495 (-),score=107.86 c1780_g1_i1:19-1503(-)
MSQTADQPFHSLDNGPNEQQSRKFRPWMIVAAIGAVACCGVVAAAALSSSPFTSEAKYQTGSSVRLPETYISGQQLLDTQENQVDVFQFYKTAACPFAQWFSRVHQNMPLWEDELVTKYEDKWNSMCNDDGCPEGFAENDHNYNTVLGQGNTLGFVPGYLQVYSNLPSKIQKGLFSQQGATIPLIARFSDFGADSSALRLARLALKVPYTKSARSEQCQDGTVLEGGSWAGEVNLLFTESMDTFPLADYADLADFASDKSVSTWDSLTGKFHAAQVFIDNGWRVFSARNKGLLEKEYYSQLPYQLGCDQAMKFRVVPKSSCGDSDAKFAEGVRQHLESCDAVFELQLQVKSFKGNYDAITNQASTRWSEDYIAVAKVVLPQQSISNDGVAASDLLRDTLGSRFSLSSSSTSGVHKLLAFHPLMTASEHRPLGEINSFRSHFYSRHATSRFQTLLRTIYAESAEPVPGKPDYQVFDGLSWEDWMQPLKHVFSPRQ